MIPGLDSSSEPSASQIAQAYNAGVRVWGGYIGPGAYHDWSPATFEAVRGAGMGAVAFAFPQSDPGQMRAQAGGVGALLCLDNAIGDTPNPYAAANATWLATARQGGPAGMYGQPAVLNYWKGHYDFAIVCGSGNTSTNNPLGLSVPSGNQYWNTHTEFGMAVDRGWYDPWFEEAGMAVLPAGFWQGLAVLLSAGTLQRTREGDGSPGSNLDAAVAGAIMDNPDAFIAQVHGVTQSQEFTNLQALTHWLEVNATDGNGNVVPEKLAAALGVHSAPPQQQINVAALQTAITNAINSLETLSKEITSA